LSSSLTITIGTGLGTGVFHDGVLVPNFELGRILHTDGQPIEFYAANSARKKHGLSYKEWPKNGIRPILSGQP
jgi:polyphosphate glucokinase